MDVTDGQREDDDGPTGGEEPTGKPDSVAAVDEVEAEHQWASAAADGHHDRIEGEEGLFNGGFPAVCWLLIMFC